jgi:pimeloyl-ACP methyl ester carboxylesterase
MENPVLTHVVAGNGPALVLLNGGLMSLRAWDGLAEPLEPRCRVVRCDLRGQLLSPGPPPASLQGHADDVVRLLDHLDLADAHVVGTSFGALVGLTLAASHPTRMRSLVAMTATDQATPEMWEGAVALIEACRAAARGGDAGHVFDLVVPGTFSPEFRLRHAADLAARREAIAALPRSWFTGLEGLLAALQGLDLRPILPRITCPTLVLAAGHDQTFPLSHSQSLAAALPNARLRIVPEASHAVVLEEPDVVVESIVEFLDEVELKGVRGALAERSDAQR